MNQTLVNIDKTLFPKSYAMWKVECMKDSDNIKLPHDYAFKLNHRLDLLWKAINIYMGSRYTHVDLYGTQVVNGNFYAFVFSKKRLRLGDKNVLFFVETFQILQTITTARPLNIHLEQYVIHAYLSHTPTDVHFRP